MNQFYRLTTILQVKILSSILTSKNNLKIMEITDDKLLKIALVTSLIGLVGLIAFTPTIEVKEVDIKDINRGMIDEEVSIKGVITDVAQSSSKTSYFLTINDGEAQIQLIIFESQVSEIQSKNLDIEDFKNRRVQVVGTVTQYNSEMELILSKGDSLRIIT